MSKPIYLDYAAATPLDPEVFKAMQPYFTERFYNPSALYAPAVLVRKEFEAARARVARILGARPSEIIFTAGGTEANNLAIRGVLERFPGSSWITSAIEHESVLKLAPGSQAKQVPVTAQGLVDVGALKKQVDDSTVLVSIMYANNEIGTIQPLRQISQTLAEIHRKRRTAGNERPLYFHTDAAQAAAYADLHVARLGVDFMTINAGKIYGPKQCGALFVSHRARLQPQILGGGQERGLRSGTENVAGAIGLATALELVQARRAEETVRLKNLQSLFFKLLEEKIPHARVNGSRKQRLPSNVHITIPNADNERLLIELDQAGILCAAGSACSASSEEPSHVLHALGLSEAEARASLRFTMGRHTTEADVRHTVTALASLIS